MARIPPLPTSEWSPEMRGVIEGFRTSVTHANTADGADPRIRRPTGANLLGTLAHYPALAQAFLTFNGHLLYGATLSARQRELLVLRVAARRHCGYEWAQHMGLAQDAGLAADELSRVLEGPDAAGWTPADRALLRSVDELLDGATVSARTWDALRDDLDDRQLMDLVFTVGTYDMVAMAIRSFALDPEPDLAPHLPTGDHWLPR